MPRQAYFCIWSNSVVFKNERYLVKISQPVALKQSQDNGIRQTHQHSRNGKNLKDINVTELLNCMIRTQEELCIKKVREMDYLSIIRTRILRMLQKPVEQRQSNVCFLFCLFYKFVLWSFCISFQWCIFFHVLFLVSHCPAWFAANPSLVIVQPQLSIGWIE